MRLMQRCGLKEIADWLFFRDQRPAVLPETPEHSSFMLNYEKKELGPLSDPVLQPFSILNTPEWDEGEYLLGSAMGFRAGDARFFFIDQSVELLGRRMAVDLSGETPVYWENQVFDNHAVVLSRQHFTEFGEPIRLTEVFTLDEPEKLIARSRFQERRFCQFCVMRGIVCECTSVLRNRTLGPLAKLWQSEYKQTSTSATQKYRRFLSTCKIVGSCEWQFDIEMNIQGAMVPVTNAVWIVEYEYALSSSSLNDCAQSFMQQRILALTPPSSPICFTEPAPSSTAQTASQKTEGLEMVVMSPISNDPPSNDGSLKSTSVSSTLPKHLPSDGALSSPQAEIHKSNGPSTCEFCGSVFGRVYEMRRHVANVHNQRRDFLCDRCGKAFTQKGHLTKHIFAVHEDIRNVPCSQCDLKFRTKCKARRHFRAVHLSLRPYMCNTCGSSFQQKSDVKRHILARHPQLEQVGVPQKEESFIIQSEANQTVVRS